ncbi:hypothetical protein IT411_01870 [Candidatus Peregrinibacteria bacterium]|nr:hypothetical protein [Candidatus Peregrinibacteria bacterium]
MKRLITTISILMTLALSLPGLSLANSLINMTKLDIKTSNGLNAIIKDVQPGESFSQELELTNYSEEKLDIELIKNNAEEKNSQFKLDSENSYSDINNWASLSENKISLNPRETKKIKVNFLIPESAGVGEHLGAIVARYTEKTAEADINIEHGIRLKLNVLGAVQNDFVLINPNYDQVNKIYSGIIYNSGNTFLKGKISVLNNNLNAAESGVYIQPKESENFQLKLDETSADLKSVIELNNLTKTFVINSDNGDIDITSIIFALLVIAGLALLAITKKLKPIQVIAATIGIALMSIIFNNIGLNHLLRADLTSHDSTSYVTTIKWGQFNQEKRPETKTRWNGSFQVENGEFFILQKLHNESTDQIYLNSKKDTLYFENITGPDNDGVIILVKGYEGNSNPKIIYNNNLTREEVDIRLASTLLTAKMLDYRDENIQIKSELAGEYVNSYHGEKAYQLNTRTLNSVEIIQDIQSTTEIGLIEDGSSTPEIVSEIIPVQPIQPDNSKQLAEEINLLQNIIQDIPASPDVLSEYILNSEFVKDIVSENHTTTVKADPHLIDTLGKTPLTIEEITSTPNVNFIFMPSEKINLPPQQFSFQEKRYATQELGEIIFVQNKDLPWNTSISISSFSSLSGNSAISANHITINPGTAKVISQNGDPAVIETGIERKFTSENDQINLVTVLPNGNLETIFSMHPTVTVEIPAGTPPGTYHANITIRVI